MKLSKFLSSRLQSIKYALNGGKLFLKEEPNALVHIVFAAMALIIAIYLNISRYEWIAISICIGLVLSAEMLNSALEKTLDILHPTQSPNVKYIKDVAAMAVLVVSILSLVVAAIIFIPLF